MTPDEYKMAAVRIAEYEDLNRDLSLRIAAIDDAERTMLKAARSKKEDHLRGRWIPALDKKNIERIDAHIHGICNEQRAEVRAEYAEKIKAI